MPRKSKVENPKDSKPSVADILELYDEVKRIYDESGIYTLFDDDDKYYELDFSNLLNLPEEFKKDSIVLPTARDIVDTCVDHTDIFNARVYINRKGTDNSSKEEQNLMRKFGLGVLYRNNIESSIAPVRVGAKHYWLYGLCILKTVWDADRYVDKPEKDDGESEDAYAERIDQWRAESRDSIPIVIQSVHPRNIMLDPYTNSNEFVFETNEELVFNVRQRFPGWQNPMKKKVTDKVVHISFWSKNYRCELYDREPVLKVGGGVAKHSYGFIPYVPIDTGLGNLTSDNDIKKRYVGVLRYVKNLIISESRDYSIGDVILKKNAFPWGYLKGQNAQAVTEIFQKYGEYNALPDGVEIVDMNPKVPPEALLTWMSTASSYLAAHAAPPSVRGLGEAGVRSGTDRRQLIAEASIRYTYSNEAFRNGVSKVLSNCARIMKNVVPGNIHVWAKTPTDEFDIEIDKAQMKEPFTFYVEFSPISEEDEYRRHDDLERLVKSGMVTVNWARTQMSNVDPEALALESEIELLKNDPAVQQLLSQYFAGKLMEALAKKTMAEQVANPSLQPPLGFTGQAAQPPNAGGLTGTQGQTPGRRMQPPIPSVAVPGSAPALQNQMANMRSSVSMTEQGKTGGGNRR